MASDILLALGGVGLFLIGMLMLTDSLRGLAGRSLRDVLSRFTSTPLSGAVTGALTTAAIQSSSATTVTAVGFVGAGLLSFPQALGIIFGANIGTTLTGWLVAILGFKLNLGALVLPLVFLGALMRLFGTSRGKLLGSALAGFSLLFIGIDAMQDGLGAFEGIVSPADFPGDSWLGRAELVLIGVAITLVTQSSSAGVATALAALGAGAISFPQAAAMVIGMDVGTTFTALLATLGGSTATRRTGAAHVTYNVITGVMAFLLLGVFTDLFQGLLVRGESQIALVAFHSSFNLLGVALVLPATRSFARLIEAMVPERGARLTRRLDQALLRDTHAAVDAAVATVDEVAAVMSAGLAWRLGMPAAHQAAPASGDSISEALSGVRLFIEKISADRMDQQGARQIMAALHIVDHLSRLHFRMAQAKRIGVLPDDARLRRLGRLLGAMAAETSAPSDPARSEARLDRLRQILRDQRRRFRTRTIAMATKGGIEDEIALTRLDAARWLHRVAYHLWRIRHHLNLMRAAEAPATRLREAEIEVAQD